MTSSLLLLLLLLMQAGQLTAEVSTNETEAAIWFDQFDAELGVEKNRLYEAAWINNVNITAASRQNYIQASLRYSGFLKRKRTEMDQKFAWKNFKNMDLRRKFFKGGDIGTAVASEDKQTRLTQLTTTLAAKYSTATVKDPRGSGKDVNLDNDLVPIMADLSTSEQVKRLAWVRWRDATGRHMLQNYSDFVQVSNEMIKEAGYNSITEYWQSWYEQPEGEFEKSMEELWNEVLPFYKQLHAYVRRRLRVKFGHEIFPPTGQIPAHILGNMWAQSWQAIEKLATPFPDESIVDITDKMKEQKWDTKKMFRVSEDFFASLGMDNMSSIFWEKSVLDRVPNVQMNCHASAWDFYANTQDFRVKQCTRVTTSYLGTTHHEMGHIQYYHEYEKQPVVYRRGANPGFHEAVGDTIELAVMTPDHLKAIGLLDETIESKNYYLNYLFQMALKKLAFIPFGYLIDMWRWRAFDGTFGMEKYNSEWWKLRCRLQGVASPVKRTDADFDPGAKYHVPGNTPYIRYFISHLLQFQIYETLCKKANHTGPLYRCDFYRNKVAGEAMRKMLQPGSSRHWEDVLEEFAGTRKVSAAPLMRYFNDLKEYLTEENRKSGEKVGWEDDCPSDDWYDKSARSLTASAGLVTAMVAVVWRIMQ